MTGSSTPCTRLRSSSTARMMFCSKNARRRINISGGNVAKAGISAKPIWEMTFGSLRFVWRRNWITSRVSACKALGGLESRGDEILNRQSSEMIDARTEIHRARSSGARTCPLAGEGDLERLPIGSKLLLRLRKGDDNFASDSKRSSLPLAEELHSINIESLEKQIRGSLTCHGKFATLDPLRPPAGLLSAARVQMYHLC
jgi:hypothetical protein